MLMPSPALALIGLTVLSIVGLETRLLAESREEVEIPASKALLLSGSVEAKLPVE